MSKALKYILFAVVSIIIIAIAVIIYRMFFQFDAKEIKIYVREEAEKYKNSDAVYKLIMDAVEYILSSNNLTQQVLKASKATGTDKEQLLVHRAILQCKSFGYLK